jgi:serine phosphatase RsbU (regulator of sigma subunit)
MPFRTPYPSPDCRGSFHWRIVPHHEEVVSGDAIFIEDDRCDGSLLFVVLDVTGHGPQAAEVVAMLAEDFLTDPECWSLAPAALLGRLHGMLANYWALFGSDEFDQWYVEAVAVSVQTATGALLGARAGGWSPWLGRGGAPWKEWAFEGGGWLGVPNTAVHVPAQTTLAQGEMLLAFSDGVYETPHGRAQFGSTELERFLNCRGPETTGPQLLEELYAALHQFTGAHALWPQDDTTAYVWQPAEAC